MNKHVEITDEPLENDEEAVITFMAQYYTAPDAVNIPPTIITFLEPDSCHEIEHMLEAHSGHRVKVIFPKRGDKRTFLDYAILNSQEEINRVLSSEDKTILPF